MDLQKQPACTIHARHSLGQDRRVRRGCSGDVTIHCMLTFTRIDLLEGLLKRIDDDPRLDLNEKLRSGTITSLTVLSDASAELDATDSFFDVKPTYGFGPLTWAKSPRDLYTAPRVLLVMLSRTIAYCWQALGAQGTIHDRLVILP